MNKEDGQQDICLWLNQEEIDLLNEFRGDMDIQEFAEHLINKSANELMLQKNIKITNMAKA